MKEVTAVIRMNRINQTKKALAEIGVYSMTARKVMGRGKGKVDYLLLKGAQEGYEEAINQLGPGPKMIPKRMVTMVLPDTKVEPAVKAIIGANQTGSPGDGKIFVRTVAEAIRVRTGEINDVAIDEQDG